MQAKAIVVPTDDSEVKVRLREQGEPICEWAGFDHVWEWLCFYDSASGLFGEDPANRRERLRGLLSARLEKGEQLESVEEATITATEVSLVHSHACT